jgi:hypothetical protein
MQGSVALLSYIDDSPEADEEIATHLEVAVWRRLRGRISSLRIDVSEGGLILRGSAPSYYVKQLVQHAVMSESILPIHANDIEVSEPLRRRIH